MPGFSLYRDPISRRGRMHRSCFCMAGRTWKHRHLDPSTKDSLKAPDVHGLIPGFASTGTTDESICESISFGRQQPQSAAKAGGEVRCRARPKLESRLPRQKEPGSCSSWSRKGKKDPANERIEWAGEVGTKYSIHAGTGASTPG